jgi:hypothetical protein
LLKVFVKKTYQYLNWLLYQKKYRVSTPYSIKTIDDATESFGGYYDKSPVSPDDTYLLYYVTAFNTKNAPHPMFPIEILVKNIITDEIILRIPSVAYNWQQGCRAQWVSADLFIFNDFIKGQEIYISRLWSISLLKEIKSFAYPVQDSYKDDYFLSLNYRRLMSLRPDYGYRNLPPLTTMELQDNDGDGIWRIDYETGNSRLLVNLSTIMKIKTNSWMTNALHKVNHIMISPSGAQFILIHRYYVRNRRFDRLFLADSETGELRLLADNEMVSHCFWVDENTIMGYMRGPNRKDAYWFIDIVTGQFANNIADDKLNQYGDGHPHIQGDWFVTDTYPDKARMQHLFLTNWRTGEFKELGEFFHGFTYSGETRCDLHPRFLPNGKVVLFDSVFSGKRRLYKIEF